MQLISGRAWILALAAVVVFSAVNAEENVEQCSADRLSIAVIGSGIGGSITAHHAAKLAEQFEGTQVIVDVFERSSHIGGRLQHFLYNDTDVIEAGGSIIHQRNQYMLNLTEAMGLNRSGPGYGEHAVLGLFDGERVIFQTSDYELVSILKMLMRYGLSPYYMDNLVNDLLVKFDGIYRAQAEGLAFDTVEDLLGHVALYDLTQKPLREYLRERGIGDTLADELVTGVMRTNYGQDLNMNAFAGAVSLAGASEHLWAIEGGNNKLCSKLLDQPNIQLHLETTVERIGLSEAGRPVVFISGQDSRPYDAVVIATPLEESNIQLDEAMAAKIIPRTMHTTVATFVEGSINSTYYGIRPELRHPALILTKELENVPFNCIGLVADNSTHKNTGLFKVFSRSPLTKEDLQLMFLEYKEDTIQEYQWKAYPKFTPPESFSPFVLGEGVFYPNAIENSASAMEMSAIAAKNAVLLIQKMIQDGWCHHAAVAAAVPVKQEETMTDDTAFTGSGAIPEQPAVAADDVERLGGGQGNEDLATASMGQDQEAVSNPEVEAVATSQFSDAETMEESVDGAHRYAADAQPQDVPAADDRAAEESNTQQASPALDGIPVIPQPTERRRPLA
eukprot:m.117570 g.117570  ORF g.117570 m.117570 type:complete len:618 (-) comp15432_c0_seq3:28-1881(-)